MNRRSGRRIAVVTGIRSEYDVLYTTLRSIQEHDHLELQLLVTGAHLSDLHGRTVREIERDGFPIAERVQSFLASDTTEARAKSVGIQLSGLAAACARLQPDILLAPCDREEAVTTALVGTYLNIPVAHLYGGDRTISGIVDEPIRHAATRLAHVHLVMTEEHGQRVCRLGEEAWRVHVVGHGGLDRILDTADLSREELGRRLGVPLLAGTTAVVIQHPMTNDIVRAGQHMRTTLSAVARASLQGVVVYPNSDVGSLDIVEASDEFVAQHEGWVARTNLPRLEFVNLLRHADVLVGNSSLGILEAPFLRLPTVNIGPRQRERQHGDNVLFVDHNEDDILAAVNRAIGDPEFRAKVANGGNPFGDGRTGKRVAAILAEVELSDQLLNKGMTF